MGLLSLYVIFIKKQNKTKQNSQRDLYFSTSSYIALVVIKLEYACLETIDFRHANVN